MTYRAGWERFVRMALEPTYAGTPPVGAYNEQGKYFACPTTSPVGALRPIKTRLRTIGSHGRRTSDQMAPIQAAERAEGGLDFPFASDFGGLLLLAAMGDIVSTEKTIGNVADVANPLLASAPLGPSPTSLSLDFQPTDPAILEFVIDDNVVGGTIAITGTVGGAPVTETINIGVHTAAFKYVSLNVFSAVGILGVVITGPTSGTVIINGYPPLEPSAALAAGVTTITLDDQPVAGGILEFVIDDNVVGGTIVITGTDMDDQPVIETINIGIHIVPFRYYSRNVFKSVLASGVVITGPTAGTVIINCYSKFTHSFVLANTQPSLRVEEFGDAGAGSGNSWYFTGLLVETLGLAFDAAAEDGLLVLSPNFQGQFPSAAAESTYQMPLRRAFAAWTAAMVRNLTPYARLMNMSMSLANNAKPIRTAQGSVSPTQPTFGARALSGQMRILTEDDNEFLQYTNATLAAIVLSFVTPYKLGAGAFESMTLHLDEIYIETYETGEEAGLFAATLGFYSKDAPTNNALTATLINTVPYYAVTP